MLLATLENADKLVDKSTIKMSQFRKLDRESLDISENAQNADTESL
jgi:hypothetical protein